MENHQLPILDVAVELEGQIDDGKLQPLRPEHRHHLHGGGVVVQAPEAFRRCAFVTLCPQPVPQSGQAEVLTVRGVLQQLGHVGKVGHQSLAALPRQNSVAHTAQLGGLEDRGDTTLARMTRPLPQRLRNTVGQCVTAGDKRLSGFTEEHRRRGCSHHARPVRLLECLQQTKPVLRGSGFEDVGVAGVDRRYARFAQRVETGAGVLVLLDNHGDMTRPDLLAVERGAARQQIADVGGHIGGYMRTQVADQYRVGAAAAHRLSAHHPQTERIVGRGTREARPDVVRFHWVHDDLRITESGSPQDHLQALNQIAVATPVGRERPLHTCGFRSLEIGDDVSAAERVDGLLRIPDEDQRRAARECTIDHLPLHGVGVLEFVDHDDRPPLMHLQLRRRVVSCERIGKPGEQVVVAKDPPLPFTGVHLSKNTFREADAYRGTRVGFGSYRPQFGRGMLYDLASQLQRICVAQHGVVTLMTEVAEIEVVDDLGDQLVQALHQCHTGVAVTCHPKRFENHLTELVCGGDRCGVEGGQRVAQALTTSPQLLLASLKQARNNLVVPDRGWIVETRNRVDDLAAHTVAQLLCRRAAERDQKHLVQRRDALGDITGDQTRQRERLAGPRTCFQHRGRTRRG